MKRKLVTLLMVLIMCVSVFSGCSLWTRNDRAYYEAVVATITYTNGEKDTISKRELLTAYNSYGYNYVDNYGYTMKKAINETLETIIDKRLTIKAVENYYAENPSEGVVLNGNETTYLWDSTYDGVYSNFKNYFLEVLEIDSSDDEENTTEEASASVYTPYNMTAYLEDVGGKLVIKKATTPTTIRETYVGRKNANQVYYDFEYKDAEGKEVFKELMYTKLFALTNTDDSASAKIWKSAFNNYVADIKENYAYKNFKTDKDWFMFELDRVYDIMKDNYMVEKYSVIFNMQEHQDIDTAPTTVKDVLNYYSAKVRADYTKYKIEGDTGEYASSILSNIGDVDYILEDDTDADYFYVASIKLEMTEEQKAELTNLESQLAAQTITEMQYNSRVEMIYDSIVATRRDSKTGEKTNDTVSAQNLLSRIENAVAGLEYITVDDLTAEQIAEAEGDGKTLQQYVDEYNKYTVSYGKADAFRQYLYAYSDSDDLKGAEYNTVFGINSAREVLAGDAFSEQTAVKDAVKALFNDGNAKIGDTTDFVRTDDGLYMFFYAGKIENLFKDIDVSFDASTNENAVKTLTSTRLNIFSSKTVFDKIYESLTVDNFSVFENMNISYLRSELTVAIKAIENNLKDLY